ncbi:ATP-binding cassette domain-containing protein [Candidatus Peregrinibacteria bacterium]|nr:ATP-binding cassette domain-containing protein [Candidatus Peregrinibacteria bacterium]
MIICDKIVKKYKNKKVLNELTLVIMPGEFVSIVGPSGAGKSTLVHALIGAERIQGGSITVDGYRVSEMTGKELQFYRRRIGVVFQDYRLLPQKTVFENVAFALEVCGVEKAKIKPRVMEVLKMVGLTGMAEQFPYQLSGGERQRTAIARSLVHDPGMLVADEPTGNLDPKTALEIMKLFLEINKNGISVLLTTHNKDLVNFAKRRVVKIEDGRVVEDKGGSEYII